MMKNVFVGFILFFSFPCIGTCASAVDFAKLPAFSNPQLSPDGKKVAATVIYEGKPLVITRSLVKDENSAGINAIRVGDLHLDGYVWANNTRLIVYARSSFKNWGVKINIRRMAAVNFDGTDPVFLPMEKGLYGYMQYPKIVDPMFSSREEVLASLDYEQDTYFPKVQRVNIYTGRKKTIQRNSKEIIRWMADHDGELRLGIKYDHMAAGKQVRIFHRGKGKKNLKLLSKADYFDIDRIQPVMFDQKDHDILVYITDANFDPDSGSTDYFENLLALNIQTGEKLGPYRYELHDEIRKSAKEGFGKSVKAQLVSSSQDKTLATVKVYSDTIPAQYFIYERAKKNFVFLADSYPQLSDVSLTRMKSVEYQARDGLTIPAYLTVPERSKQADQPGPLIVMPHGGPWARDYWGFDNYVQFFASKGYTVFQPQFRGSTGFGPAHEQSGYGEWGKKIQDDITDGVNWLLESGQADPNRVCIVGASFGGYAAAMGTVKTPDLYKCAISINGVLDLPKKLINLDKLLFSTINKIISNDFSSAKKYSPYHQAKTIKTPTLIIASKDDTVVDVAHSRSFVKRMKKLKKDVEYLEFKGGEHWRTDQTIEEKTFQAMEDFLARHLN